MPLDEKAADGPLCGEAAPSFQNENRPDPSGPGRLSLCQISYQRISLAASSREKLDPSPRYTVVDWGS